MEHLASLGIDMPQVDDSVPEMSSEDFEELLRRIYFECEILINRRRRKTGMYNLEADFGHESEVRKKA